MRGHDLSLLLAAAKAAGEIATHYFGRSIDTHEKPDGAGPVTQADLEIDALLSKELRQARPDYGWLSEETEDETDRLSKERVFVVDPIDGTRSFIEGSRNFATAIAVVENRIPTIAVVALPARGLVYAAEMGMGATLNGDLIAASVRDEITGAQVLSSEANLRPEHWREVPPITRVFRSSLAYRMSLVAQGRFDGMLTLRPSWEWDIAAGDLIAREAGAVVSDQTGAALRFNNPQPQVNGVVAAPRSIHQGLMQRLKGRA